MRKKRGIVSEGRLKNRVTFKSHRQDKIALKHPKLEFLSCTKPLDSLLVSDKEIFKTTKKLLTLEVKLKEAKIRLLNAKTIAVIVSTILGILTFIITAVLPQFSNKRYHQLRGVFEDKEFNKLYNEFCFLSSLHQVHSTFGTTVIVVILFFSQYFLNGFKFNIQILMQFNPCYFLISTFTGFAPLIVFALLFENIVRVLLLTVVPKVTPFFISIII